MLVKTSQTKDSKWQEHNNRKQNSRKTQTCNLTQQNQGNQNTKLNCIVF